MADETVIATAVEQAAQASDPNTIANELAAAIKPLLESLDSLELGSRHEIGVILASRLKPAGQRLTYGGKVMEKLAGVLDISRSNLNRMCQFAVQFPTLADFEAKHPNVKTWSGVKEALVKPTSANRTNIDLTPAHLRQCAQSLANYVRRFDKSLNSSHANLFAECQRNAQELAEVFQKHLSTSSAVVQNGPDAEPSPAESTAPEGDTQLES